MNILLAIKSLNGQGGGAEKVLVDVANGLHVRGHQVRVLTFDYPGEAFYDLLSQIQRRDMAFVPASEPIPRLGLLRALPRMRAVIATEKPDVIVAFMHSTYVPVAVAALGLRIPLIVSEHTDAMHYKGRYMQNLCRKLVDRFADLRTVPSESARRSFIEEDGCDAMVVPNPVHAQMHGQNSVAGVPDLIISSVGGMRPEKDHAVLLDAFAQVVEGFPEWRLQIVGDGPLRGALEAQVARLDLGTRVEMPGFTRDVSSAYTKAHFVVLPSRYESFGMVAAEALAAGRAVLCFDDCTGIAEFVESGKNGLLVRGKPERAARVAALAEGLRRMMGDPDFCARLGAAGPASVAKFGLEAVLDRWEEVFHRVAPPRAPDRSLETGT